jgi:hypothetical protein
MKINSIKQLLIITFVTAITSNLSIAQTGKVHSNGITIAYEAFGNKDNEAIILIQGTGATMLHYPEELCQKLASKGFYVIRFDNRDIGLSTHLDSLGQPDWNAIGPYVGTCLLTAEGSQFLSLTCPIALFMSILSLSTAPRALYTFTR